CHPLANKLTAGYLRSPGHSSVGIGQLLIGLFGDDPALVVHPGYDIGDTWVQPEVCHSEDGLRPQCGTGHNGISHPELDQGEVHDGGILPLEDVVVLHRIPVVWAPAHRMAALD